MLFLSTALLLFLLKEGSQYSRLWFVLWYSFTNNIKKIKS